jgi:hypothetical protein
MKKTRSKKSRDTVPLNVVSCIQNTYSHREGGWGEELNREKVRGAIVYKSGRKNQHDWLYLQSIKHHAVKTTIRIWCLYSLLVHATVYFFVE